MHAEEINTTFEDKVRRRMFRPVSRDVINHPKHTKTSKIESHCTKEL